MEHLDVLIVGAGLSGIGAAHHLQTDCPWASYAILEGRAAIGGTWDLFRYPGIRSDSDMHTLGYSFRPWSQEKAIAEGASILQYIKDTASEAGIDTHIRFRHRVVFEQHTLQLEWADAIVRRFEHVVGTADESQITIIIEEHHHVSAAGSEQHVARRRQARQLWPMEHLDVGRIRSAERLGGLIAEDDPPGVADRRQPRG